MYQRPRWSSLATYEKEEFISKCIKEKCPCNQKDISVFLKLTPSIVKRETEKMVTEKKIKKVNFGNMYIYVNNNGRNE